MTTVTHTTAEELLLLTGGQHRYELVQGELRTMNPAGFEHGDIALEMGMRLRQFVKQHKLGRVLGAETGFLLEQDPDTVLAPDVAFVRQERIDQIGLPRSYFPGAPDLAVEVISPSETEQRANDDVVPGFACRVRDLFPDVP